LAPGCEEENTTLVTDIGIVGLILTDPSLGPQSIDPDDDTLQVMYWKLTAPATLIRDDGESVDMLFGETCEFVQTVSSPLNAIGACSDGIVLGATGDEPETIQLEFTVAILEIAWAEKVDLPPTGDYEGDGRKNAVDNCPLIANFDQQDTNEDGVGDACTLPGSDPPLQDSEGDGVPDVFDNCVWVQNPDQADTTGIGFDHGLNIPDGIGDACVQLQEFVVPPNAAFPAGAGFTVALTRGGISFVTVDFDDNVSLNREVTPPELVPENVQKCGVQGSLSLSIQGCP
jgi:hypothetical protein